MNRENGSSLPHCHQSKRHYNVTIIFYIEVSMSTKIRYLWGFLFSFCLNFLKKITANLNCFQSRYILLFSCDVCCCCCWSRIPKLAPSSLVERYCPTSSYSQCPSVSQWIKIRKKGKSRKIQHISAMYIMIQLFFFQKVDRQNENPIFQISTLHSTIFKRKHSFH